MCDNRRIHYGHSGSGSHRSMRWRTARVPKGLLRHYVLKLLNEKSMSGSEIMSTILSRTNERWEPSPGSVYPLLSWLNDSGFTEAVEDEDTTIKRYTLTEAGRKFLAEHDEMNPNFDESLPDTGPRFRGDIADFPKDVRELIRDFRGIRRTSRKLIDRLRKNYSEDVVKETRKALNEFLDKLNKLAES